MGGMRRPKAAETGHVSARREKNGRPRHTRVVLRLQSESRAGSKRSIRTRATSGEALRQMGERRQERKRRDERNGERREGKGSTHVWMRESATTTNRRLSGF
eukprot:6192950-Pleurochrysis_carterae.AAC.2